VEQTGIGVETFHMWDPFATRGAGPGKTVVGGRRRVLREGERSLDPRHTLRFVIPGEHGHTVYTTVL